MVCTLSWYVPEEVLYLAVEGQPTVEELRDINQQVVEILDQSHMNLNIVIDALNMHSGYRTADDLRDTQKYMNHSRLDTAFVVADNKLNRLIMLMAFCVSRTTFLQFDDFQKAEDYLKQRRFG